LLKSGVIIKCIICDPGSKIVNEYSKSVLNQKNELPIESIEDSISKLKKIQEELNGYSGKIMIYKYSGIMKFHLSSVDIDEDNGKMYISNYLNGVSRADCPGFEIYKKYNPDAYKQYKIAYDNIMTHSILIA